jgi:hypothetical protein
MPVSLAWLNPSHPKSLNSHELHLQFNIDQGKVRNDAAKLKKESEKARKALCKENEKNRKEKQKLLVVIVKLQFTLPTRMNFLQYLSHKVHPN